MRSSRTSLWGYVIAGLVSVVLAGCTQPDIRPETALLERPYKYSDRDWAHVLKTYVRNGLVDYESLAAHPQELERYYALVSVTGPATTPADFSSRAAATAYWINAYNAMVLKAVLVRYPTKSMYDLSLPRLETEFTFKVDGQIRTLADAETQILQASGNDVRALFATSRAALGTPALSSQPIMADYLDRQLAMAAAQALDDPRIMRVDPVSHSIHLWQLILRRQGDFEEYWRSRRRASAVKLLDVLLDLASPRRRQTLQTAVGYTFRAVQFDRTLNNLHERAQVP